MNTQTTITLSAPAKSGYRETFDTPQEAEAKAAELLGCTPDDLVLVDSPDGGTVYCYASQADADEDQDGAYAVQYTGSGN